jgi:hypothetical protein
MNQRLRYMRSFMDGMGWDGMDVGEPNDMWNAGKY